MNEIINHPDVKDTIVHIIQDNEILDFSLTADTDELEPEGNTRRFKPNGILELYVKLQSQEEQK